MTATTFKASIPNAVPQHFTVVVLDQYGRIMANEKPTYTLATGDTQTVVDANSGGFTTTLAVGGTSGFIIADGAASCSVEIDSPPAVASVIQVTQDAPPAPAAS